MRKSLLFAPWLLAIILWAASLQSLPRLAVEQGASCGSCHLNPNGGAMRNEFGHYSVAANELTLQSTKKKYKPLGSPRLTDNLTFGLDYRMLHLDDGRFFRMQTDFYLSAQLYRWLSYNLTLKPGDIKESFGLANFADGKYWLKAGRFYPSFGLRNADHNAFTRMVPGLAPELTLDGIALGATVADINLTFEHYQPAQQAVGVVHAYRAWALGPLGYLAGLSYRQSEKIGDGRGSFPIAKAVFGGVSYDRFTMLGEFNTVGEDNKQQQAFTQLTTRLVYGLYLIGEYNFHDPDSKWRTGVEEFYRFSVEFFPVPFVELRPSFTTYTNGPRKDDTEFFLQLHLNY